MEFKLAEVFFPNSCTEQAIFNFCDQVSNHSNADELLINFSNLGRIEPFTMVYVAKFIRDFSRENPKVTTSAIGHHEKTYAANMAFFRAFGLKHGREPNCTNGNGNFVPYTILRVQTIVDEAGKEWDVEQNIIEKRAEHLAQILSRQDSSHLVDALTFSIREVLRNVFEHSNSKTIEYCAQYWPAYNKVEIAVVDNGIGLGASLKDNPFVQVDSHCDAIQQALMPAISSKNYKGAVIDKDDPWHNSGFGLYMINRICRLGGSFTLCTGNHGIRLDESGKTHIDLPHLCRGTAVRMVLNTNRLTKLSEMLSEFRDEGYEIAKQIKGVGIYTASAASQMLSRDFK